jgi:hypothetical protein
MTITLKPETVERLRERASREGTDVETLADILLLDALAEDPDDLTADEAAEVRAGIRRGLEAAALGKERRLDEYIADVKKRRVQRRTGT